jgi:hypothetical protein
MVMERTGRATGRPPDSGWVTGRRSVGGGDHIVHTRVPDLPVTRAVLSTLTDTLRRQRNSTSEELADDACRPANRHIWHERS